MDPQNAMFQYRRGVQLLMLRDFNGAIKSLKKAAALNPNSGRYYKRLCEAQTGSGDLSAAKASCQKAAQLSPGDPEIKLREGLRLLKEKKYDRAIPQFELIGKQDSAVIFCRANMGKSTALRESGQAAKAVKHMEAFFEQVPAGCQADVQAELWCELGQNYLSVRNKEQAIQAFTVGIEQYPYYADCHYYLAKAFGRGPEVKDACKRYLAVAPRGIHAKECEKKVNR